MTASFSNLVASNDEGEHDTEGAEPEQESEGHPHDQVHAKASGSEIA